MAFTWEHGKNKFSLRVPQRVSVRIQKSQRGSARVFQKANKKCVFVGQKTNVEVLQWPKQLAGWHFGGSKVSTLFVKVFDVMFELAISWSCSAKIGRWRERISLSTGTPKNAVATASIGFVDGTNQPVFLHEPCSARYIKTNLSKRKA